MDGLTWDKEVGYSAATPVDWEVNRPSADWGSSSVQPAAADWGDVLKYGFSRLVDAKVRPVQPENTAPVLASAASTQGSGADKAAGGLGGMTPWLVIGGLAIAALIFFNRSA